MATCVRGHVDPPRYDNGQCKLCAKEKAEEWRNKPGNKAKRQETERLRALRQRAADKQAAFEYYGVECGCCGEATIELLTIDHIDGNGAQHRREMFGENYKASRPPAGSRTYRWLRLNGYPEGFQTLCFNCNYGKHVYGECPHKLNINIGLDTVSDAVVG